MSEVIVRMEMPTGCPHCPMADDDSRFCKAAKKYIPMLGKPSWCPIKGVLPEEHGDLIDRDKLKRAFCNHCDGRDTMNGEPNCTEPCFDLGLMDCMPVIIAAERRER